jgi:hypothetical protein
VVGGNSWCGASPATALGRAPCSAHLAPPPARGGAPQRAPSQAAAAAASAEERRRTLRPWSQDRRRAPAVRPTGRAALSRSPQRVIVRQSRRRGNPLLPSTRRARARAARARRRCASSPPCRATCRSRCCPIGSVPLEPSPATISTLHPTVPSSPPPAPPLPRTDRTSLVPPLVLSGQVSSLPSY